MPMSGYRIEALRCTPMLTHVVRLTNMVKGLTIPPMLLRHTLWHVPNLGLDEHMRFTKDTIEILKDFPEKHHVHGMTWARTKRKRKRKTK